MPSPPGAQLGGGAPLPLPSVPVPPSVAAAPAAPPLLVAPPAPV